MDYQTYPSHPNLSAFVKCFWTLDGPKEDRNERQRIVPDGCMEMIFHYGDLYRQYISKDESIVQPRCFVFGQVTEALEIQATGRTGIFAVRFHPEGFSPFTTMNLKDLDNTAVALKDIFGNDGVVLEPKIISALSTEDRLNHVNRFLLDRINDPKHVNQLISSVVDTIITANGSLRVDELSETLKVNRRKLEREFSSTVGLSPKQLSKIVRIQAILKLMSTGKYKNLTELAHLGEYYDQAHFIREFKEFTGQTPKDYYQNDLKLSSLFYQS